MQQRHSGTIPYERTTAEYKIKTERDSSLWSADPFEESDFVKIVHKMSEIAKAFESQE